MERSAVLPAEPFTALLHAEELEERLEFVRIYWECDNGRGWIRCRIHIVFSLPEDGYDAESIDDTGVVDVPDGTYVDSDGTVYEPVPLDQQAVP
jgi:hypothetical protein